jgi:hypothetical protein
MDEHTQVIGQVERALAGAMDKFGLQPAEGVTVNDLACALASLVEGQWLNQCLTATHPTDPEQPIATVLRRGGRMLWRGATRPAR